MAKGNLEQFYQLVRQDQSVQQKLQEATNHESFVQLTVQLGKENGYSFTTEEVEAALTAQAANSVEELWEELSDEQLEAVAGGSLGCICTHGNTIGCGFTRNCGGTVVINTLQSCGI